MDSIKIFPVEIKLGRAFLIYCELLTESFFRQKEKPNFDFIEIELN